MRVTAAVDELVPRNAVSISDPFCRKLTEGWICRLIAGGPEGLRQRSESTSDYQTLRRHIRVIIEVASRFTSTASPLYGQVAI